MLLYLSSSDPENADVYMNRGQVKLLLGRPPHHHLMNQASSPTLAILVDYYMISNCGS
jgi:hypothetical protein